MDRLDELKRKYQSVFDLIAQSRVRLHNVHLQDNKLFVKGDAPSQEVKNNIWNQIKLVDATYADLTCDLRIDESLAPRPAAPPEPRTYTVKAGDSLWAIAQKMLGNGALYPKIIAANPGKLKDEKSVIHPGDVLVLPD